MGSVLDKRRRENKNTHFMFDKFFSRKLHSLWNNVENVMETEGPQVTS